MHLDILVYRKAVNKVESIQTEGMWIGVLDNVADMTNDMRFTIEPGDTILLCTDGIVEAIHKNYNKHKKDKLRNMFGTKKLIEILHEYGKLTPHTIVEKLLEELHSKYVCDDDVTLLALKRLE